MIAPVVVGYRLPGSIVVVLMLQLTIEATSQEEEGVAMQGGVKAE